MSENLLTKEENSTVKAYSPTIGSCKEAAFYWKARMASNNSNSNSNNSSSAAITTRKAAATTNNGGGSSKAQLTATILSTYDLPAREPPSYVSVTVLGGKKSTRTGPPSQRHKDRNSFKFNSEILSIPHSSLPELYNSTAVIQVVYNSTTPGGKATALTAEYPLKQLKIHETVWLILQLESDTDGAAGVEEDDDEDVPPTLRLQLTLSGPYRSEIGMLVDAFSTWFRTVDHIESSIHHTILSKLPNVGKVNSKYFLIPAAPILAFLVVSLPILLGLVIVTLPIALPLLVVLAGALAVVVAVLAFGYASTRAGRQSLSGIFQPMAHTVLSTALGQSLVYQTGPRWTPVHVCRAIVPDGIWGRLLVSLALDATGSASYLLPIVGEFFDIVWAPIQTMFIIAMYDADVSPNLKYVSFVEEILPFTDIVPTATIGWFMEFGLPLLMQKLPHPEDSRNGTVKKSKHAHPCPKLLTPTSGPTPALLATR